VAEVVVPARFWRAVEAIHAVVYFAPDGRATYDGIGLRGYWMGYFASRAAALGPASPELVTALFFGFAPAMVHRALPDAWRRVSPEVVLARREELAVRTLSPLVAAAPPGAVLDRLERLVPTLDLAGRPLAAAQSTVGGAASPVARLWRAVSVLREYRGDGHVAALVAAGLDGIEANVCHAATGALPAEQRSHRGWTEAEWASAMDRLRDRGWLGADGRLTAEGSARRGAIENATNAAAARALAACGQAEVDELTDDLVRLAAGPSESGVPYPNAMGVRRP
jgi:hypothetical protein